MSNDMEWVKPPLLPYCASGLERELDQALSHIETVGIPISGLWDPWKCPLVVLPYLAWAVKVNHWEESWKEQQKRQVVADSLDLHRIKGTRPAVELALSSISVRCEILEWFEKGAISTKPGSFQVTAYVSTDGDSKIDPNITRTIREVVTSAKPASRPFTLSVQGMMKTNYGCVAALRVVQARLLRMESK